MRAFRPSTWLPVVGAVCLLAGCGARTEYFASDLRLRRPGWDTARVDVTFGRRSILGGSADVNPDSVIISVFDEGYDSLYVGGPGTISLPDETLGDRERLTVEACGNVQSRWICVQETLHASAKRLQLTEKIDYPSGDDLTKGTFDFTFEAERKKFDGTGWEPIEPVGINGYLLAWVDDAEAERTGKIKVPFRLAQGQFNLSRYDNYENFRYFLDSQLLNGESAHVNFDVFAGLSETPIHLASVRKEVRQKSAGERAFQVRYFVQQATERLIDELDSFLGGRGASAYVRDWVFNSLAHTYRIFVKIEWRGPFYSRGRYELEGVLNVREDGSNASFELNDGNRRGLRRWRAHSEERTLSLGQLDPRQRRTEPIGFRSPSADSRTESID